MNDKARILGMLEAVEVQVEYARESWTETDDLAADERIDEGFQQVSDAFEALREAVERLEELVGEAAAA